MAVIPGAGMRLVLISQGARSMHGSMGGQLYEYSHQHGSMISGTYMQ